MGSNHALVGLGLALAACSGTTGTLSIDLATAPGSTIMDGVRALDVALDNPDETHHVDRAGDGSFALDLDLTAGDTTRAVHVDGTDANGATVAVGASPQLPVSAINGHVVIYMAAPFSIGAAIAPLSQARAASGVVALTYGAIVVGGQDATGAPSTAVDIYNVFDHSIVQALPLTTARSGPVVAATAANNVLVFGGTTPDGVSGDLVQLQTSVAPNGAYLTIGSFPALARAALWPAARTGADLFTAAGAPAIELGSTGVTERADVTGTLAQAGASVVAADGTITALFASGATGLVRIRNEVADTPAGDPATTDQAVCAGTAAIFAGGVRGANPVDDVVAVDAQTAARTVGHLATARTDATCAVTDRFVVVAGGIGPTGAVLADAEILDAITLAPVAPPQPLVVPRQHARAIALANGQVAIFGGTDASAMPTATIELFTPPN